MKKCICLLLCLMMIVPSAVSLANDPPITSVTVNLKAPTAGESVRDQKNPTEPSGSPYFVADCYWLTKSGSGFRDMEPDEIFEEGQDYQIDVHVIPESGYEFDPNFNVVSNADVKDHWLNNGECYITLQCTAQKKAPESTAPAESTEKVILSKLKSVKLTAVSAKKLKITWKKLSSKDKKKIKQIQIQVSTDKNFTTIVKEKILKNSKTSWTIPGLKKNTKYFVRIRAYTKDGNVINVSKWVTKNKKTKKK